MPKRPTLILAAALLLAACGGGATPNAPPELYQPGAFSRSLKAPVVVALDDTSGRLEYWPLNRNGGRHAHFLSKSLQISQAAGMVGDGDVVSIAAARPPELVTYDIDSSTATTLSDPFGTPLDIAIDTNETRYVLDSGGVSVFKSGSAQPYQLRCGLVQYGQAIAVDNEGDVFVNGYAPGPGSTPQVVEFPVGSSQCAKVPIRPEQAYVNGLGVDPKTDDLIIVDKIGCAGGHEGTMVVYERPYGTKIAHRGNLRGNCPQQFRLDATSTHILFSDGIPEMPTRDSQPRCYSQCVTQRTYPNLRQKAIYSGGVPYALTTIPNVLPN
jgi:hypothetical protein